MRITPEELDAFKKLFEFGLGQFITVDSMSNAEKAFEGGAKEFVVMPIITPIGMALILEHLEKKHGKSSDIFIIDHEKNPNSLNNALENFSKMKNGSKMSLLVWSGGHWRTAYCERKNDNNHIAIIDSLGFRIYDNPIEKTIASNPLLKNSIQYRSVNCIQVDYKNCGIFALRTAQKLMQEKNFLDRLVDGKLLLTKSGAMRHFSNSRQNPSVETDNYFIMPPEYFSLAQKKSFLKHYQNEFGKRKDIAEFKYTSRKSDKSLFIEDLFDREHRKNALSPFERNNQPDITNYNVLYFSNKYINDALVSEAKKFVEKNIPGEERRQQISSISNRHMLDSEPGLQRMLSIGNASSLDHKLSTSDTLEHAAIKVNSLEKKALEEIHMDHYKILVEEEKLEKSTLAYQRASVPKNSASETVSQGQTHSPQNSNYGNLSPKEKILHMEEHMDHKIKNLYQLIDSESYSDHVGHDQKRAHLVLRKEIKNELEALKNNDTPDLTSTMQALHKLDGKLASCLSEVNKIVMEANVQNKPK